MQVLSCEAILWFHTSCNSYEKSRDRQHSLGQERHVRAIRDAKVETQEAANGVVKARRAVFRPAVLAGTAPRNPAAEVEYLPSDGKGLHAWTLVDVRQ